MAGEIDIQKFMEEAQKYIKMPTTWIDINEVKKWDINPRTITAEGIDRLKNKIVKYPSFFFARPILANYTSDDKPLIVFAGNQRLEASLQLKLKKVPAIIFANLPEKMQKDFAIIDNHNDGEYNFDGLKLNFKEVNFEELIGTKIDFNPPKFDVPQVQSISVVQGKTEEISVDDSTIKTEQTGYPVCNNEVPNYPQVSGVNNGAEQSTKTTIKVKCPHCGEEFDYEI